MRGILELELTCFSEYLNIGDNEENMLKIALRFLALKTGRTVTPLKKQEEEQDSYKIRSSTCEQDDSTPESLAVPALSGFIAFMNLMRPVASHRLST